MLESDPLSSYGYRYNKVVDLYRDFPTFLKSCQGPCEFGEKHFGYQNLEILMQSK